MPESITRKDEANDLDLGEGVEVDGEPERKPRRRSPASNLLVVVITLAVVAAGLWIVDRVRGDDQTPTAAAASASAGAVSPIEIDADGAVPEVGGVAPDFTTFSTAGDPVILDELKGKPVWIVFGATWCANCRAEAPDVQAVQEKYGEDVTILTVYVGESISTVADYAERLGLTSAQVADAYSEVGGAYRVMGLPTHYFIDADGTISAIDVGTLTERKASDRLEAMLGK